jgi:hypothetical protein
MQNKQLLGYEELRAFHAFQPIDESTRVKLIQLTENIFKQLGYKVNSTNIKWK